MKLDIDHQVHIYHHLPGDSEILRIVKSIKEELGTMHAEVKQFITDVDAATDAIAARIDKLIADQPLPDDIKASMAAELTKLRSLGKDPENPVPAEVLA